MKDRFVTIAMLAAHAKKHRCSIIRGLRLAGIKLEKTLGVKGGRLPVKDANRFLAKQWPDVAPMSLV